MGENNEVKSTLWVDREHARQYLSSVGLAKNLPLFVRFYDGDQWPKATEATKNTPRVVTNIIKMICRNKKSAILSTPVKIIYKSERDIDAEEFTRFADYIQKEICQDELDKKGIGGGVKKGTYVFHYYWDSEARGKKGEMPGGLRCELIDPLNAYFANPAEPDEQKQKWIMFESREEVSAVKAKADKGVDLDCIVADDQDSPYASREQEGTPMCTILTRYFRKDGEVYCEKATKNIIVNAAFPITPDVKKAKKAIKEQYEDEDPANTSLPDNGEGEETITDETRAWLYPVVVGNYEPRENSIYGLGEVEGLVNNQKAINLMQSMIAYNIEQTAWSKYVVDPKALRGQRINNDPGQVLTDWSGNNGIRKLEGQQIPAAAFSIVNTIAELTRTVTGATEVMTGEAAGANMSGAAIAQLQSQAMMPVQELKETFWNVKKRQGMVLAQFFKLYYTSKQYTYEDEVDDVDDSGKPKQDAFGNTVKKTVRKRDTFDSARFRDMDMDVVVEATSGTKSSPSGDIAFLDVLLNNGGISLKTYAKLYPENAISNKQEVLKELGDQEANAVQAMQEQLTQAQQAVVQLQQTVAEQSKTIDQAYSMMEENKRLNMALIQLYTEASQKINYANQQIELGNQKIVETTEDATAMAEEIARMAGIQ